MNKKLITLCAGATLLAFPAVILAFNPGAVPTGILFNINSFIDVAFGFLWTFFAAVAVIMFMVAGFEFLTAQGDASKLKIARQSVIWASVGVALGVAAFSIPFIIRLALGL